MFHGPQHTTVPGGIRHGAADRLVRAFARLGVLAILAGLVAIIIQGTV